MRFKRPLLPVLLLLLLGVVQARDFTWAGHGTVSLDVPPGWKIQTAPPDEAGVSYSLSARPEAGATAFLQITLVGIPGEKSVGLDELAERLHTSLRPYIEQSVEKEFRPVAFKSQHGQGWYAELTDAALVGKPPVPDDYKVMRSALIALDAHTLAIATMQFDDPATKAPAEMLAMAGSLRLAP